MTQNIDSNLQPWDHQSNHGNTVFSRTIYWSKEVPYPMAYLKYLHGPKETLLFTYGIIWRSFHRSMQVTERQWMQRIWKLQLVLKWLFHNFCIPSIQWKFLLVPGNTFISDYDSVNFFAVYCEQITNINTVNTIRTDKIYISLHMFIRWLSWQNTKVRCR
jgi:hypothetical protein